MLAAIASRVVGNGNQSCLLDSESPRGGTVAGFGFEDSGAKKCGITGFPGVTGGCCGESRGNRIATVTHVDSRRRTKVFSYCRRSLLFAAIVHVGVGQNSARILSGLERKWRGTLVT